MEIILDLEFPWPPKELGGNASKHWSVRSKATKAQRSRSFALASTAVGKLDEDVVAMLANERLQAEWYFSPPDRRHRDADNMLRSVKSVQDGVFDAFPDAVDDRQIERIVVWRCPPIPRVGMVRLVLSSL